MRVRGVEEVAEAVVHARFQIIDVRRSTQDGNAELSHRAFLLLTIHSSLVGEVSRYGDDIAPRLGGFSWFSRFLHNGDAPRCARCWRARGYRPVSKASFCALAARLLDEKKTGKIHLETTY